MKIVNLDKEILTEVRKNVHQTHLEDLVLLGKEGFDELYNHIDNFINKLENKGDKINTTVKIDGAPAVVCWHEFPGYPNDSICLKSFINGPEKAKVISSEEELRAGKYADSPKMLEMLSYCLELSKYIPSREAWQGDCLFTKDTKQEREINGKNYITFLPNTIIYAFSEDNPGYENIKNADFGIAFHTIYSGSADNLSQSFRVDASRLNLPNNIYVLSPVLNSSTNKEDYGIDEILNLEDQLSLVESDLISDPAYNELVNNKEFQTFWGTFENKNYADNKLYQINVDTLIDELNAHLDNRASKMSKVGVERVRNIINNNKGTLTNMVKALNIASQIKMLLWKGFNSTSKFDYNSFYYNNETGEYTPTTMEGVAMSDDDGNIVKIVDRPTFASNNRNQAFAKGFKHENLILGEDMQDKGEIVFAFGRMNPPTKGHEKLIRFMGNISAENKPRIYLSHSQDKKRNPLSYEDKINFVKKLAEPEVDVIDTDLRELLYIVVALQQEGFSKITLVCGADRRDSFYNLLLSYNGKTLKNGSMYNFPEENINVISAGDRDPDSDDPLVKASATNMRNYALNNDFESFKENSPFDEQTSKELFTKVRKGLLLEKLSLTEDEKTFKKNFSDIAKNTKKDLNNVNSFEAAYSLLKSSLEDSGAEPDVLSQVDAAIEDIERITNSIDISLLKGLSQKLEKHKIKMSTTEFIKLFNPSADDINKLVNSEEYEISGKVDLNALKFTPQFINNLILYEGGTKKSTTNIGPFEFAMSLLFKDGTMDTGGAGDVKIGDYQVEVKSCRRPIGVAPWVVIGNDIGVNIEIIRRFDDYVFSILQGGNKSTKTRPAVGPDSFPDVDYTKEENLEAVPEEIRNVITPFKTFKELFNNVFEYILQNYVKRFNYLAVCYKYDIDFIPSNNVINTLLQAPYGIILQDYVSGRFFKFKKYSK